MSAPNDLRDWTAEQREFYEADRDLDVACLWMDVHFPQFQHVTSRIRWLLWETAKLCNEVSRVLRSNDPKGMETYLACQDESGVGLFAGTTIAYMEALAECEAESLLFLKSRIEKFVEASSILVNRAVEGWDPIPAGWGYRISPAWVRQTGSAGNWWHEPGEKRPPEYQYGPLMGTKKEVGRWMGEKDTPNPRRLEQKARKGILFVVRCDHTVWEVWFKDQKSWERIASVARDRGALAGVDRQHPQQSANSKQQSGNATS